MCLCTWARELCSPECATFLRECGLGLEDRSIVPSCLHPQALRKSPKFTAWLTPSALQRGLRAGSARKRPAPIGQGESSLGGLAGVHT